MLIEMLKTVESEECRGIDGYGRDMSESVHNEE